MRVLPLPEEWRATALVISEVDDPRSHFTPDELRVIDDFRHEKRRREWMLSRIAEKELRRRGATGVCVSYSHSGLFGAAAISDEHVGIDVELLREIPRGAVHLFLTDEEAAAAERCDIPNALLHFWSAKEAKWKQLGGTVPTLKRVPLQLIDEGRDYLRFEDVETYSTSEVIAALAQRRGA